MKINKSLTILVNLRNATAETTINEIEKLIAAAWKKFNALEEQEQSIAVKQVLEYLPIGRPTPATIHNRLDHLVPLLERFYPDNLVEFLSTVTPEQLHILPGTSESAPLYPTLRKFWKTFDNDPTPEALEFFGNRKTKRHFILTPNEYMRIHKNFTDQSEEEYIWFLITSNFHLRTTEGLGLCICDVQITGNHLTLFINGKGRMKRTMTKLIPDWMSKIISTYREKRLAACDPTEPFFDPAILPANAASKARLRRIIQQSHPHLSLHDLRRYLCNVGRVNNDSILECINALGHSTTTTTLRSYLTVLPLIQAQEMQEYYDKNWAHVFKNGLSANEIARAMNISRSAVGQYKHAMGIKSKRLKLWEAIQISLKRIKAAIRAIK